MEDEMTYTNRMLTTPAYINRFQSSFWCALAQEESLEQMEYCKHTENYLNIEIVYLPSKYGSKLSVICSKCGFIYMNTAKDLTDHLQKYGF